MILFLRFFATLALLTAAFADCPGYPWKKWNGHCYRLSASSTTWPEMQHECKSPFKQANIASVNSMAEQDFIHKNIVGKEPVWLGLYIGDAVNWTDGSSYNFTFFHRTSGYDVNYRHGVVHMAGEEGRWFLLPRYDGSKRRGVCKMEASCECGAGWIKRLSQCYKQSKCRRGWLEASMQCQRMAPLASLVTVSNSFDNDFFVKMMAGKPFWIGLNDREREGQFKWSGSAENSSVTFTNWAKSEPDGAQHKNCVQVEFGTWSAANCDNNLHYICQQPICGNSIAKKGGLIGGQSCARCPPGWICSRKKCFSKPTSPDTFEGVQKLCKKQHPRATVANISSMVDNDKAFFAAGGSLPMWIARCDSFENWQWHGTHSKTGCTSLQVTGEWLGESCDRNYPGMCQIPACVPLCPQDWHSFKGKCYFVNDITQSLTKARTFCRGAGGDLASILSQEENDFITTMAFASSRTKSTKRQQLIVFIGAVRGGGGGAPWVWEDCEPWTMSRWSNRKGGDKSPNHGSCAALSVDGGWRSFDSCSKLSMRSVCKLDPCRDYFGSLSRPNCDGTGQSVTHNSSQEVIISEAEPDQSGKCPNDGKAWREGNGTCLLSYVSTATFPAAFRTCRNFDPNDVFVVSLPVVRLEDRKRALLKLAAGSRFLWIGLTRRHTGHWYWHDVVKAPNLEWQVKPNAVNRCASIDTSTGGLVARRCTERLPFFCEARITSRHNIN